MISYVTPMQTAFFHELLASVYKPGDHLVGVYLHADKRFAFVEFKVHVSLPCCLVELRAQPFAAFKGGKCGSGCRRAGRRVLQRRPTENQAAQRLRANVHTGASPSYVRAHLGVAPPAVPPLLRQGPPVVFRLPGGGGGLVSTSVPDGPNKVRSGGCA